MLLAEHSRQGGVEIVEARALLAGLFHVVPGLVGETLHVVGNIGGEIDDRFAEPFLGPDAAAREALVDEGRELGRIDLLESHHRPGLVEGPPRPEHPLHQGWLGAREHVADLALLLHGGAQRVLHGAAVEGGDRLELVERDGEALLARLGDPARQGEHLRRDTGGIARGPHRGKAEREIRLADLSTGACEGDGRSKRISGLIELNRSVVHRFSRPTGVSAATSARA